jgi:hypothetical protein
MLIESWTIRRIEKTRPISAEILYKSSTTGNSLQTIKEIRNCDRAANFKNSRIYAKIQNKL